MSRDPYGCPTCGAWECICPDPLAEQRPEVRITENPGPCAHFRGKNGGRSQECMCGWLEHQHRAGAA